MPPKTAATKRKGPQFNPPRPVKASAQNAAATKRAPAGAAKQAASAARPSFQNATTIISSDEEGDGQDDEQNEDEDDDDLMEDAPAPTRNARPTAAASMSTPIPAPLLARLLYENFEDQNTQIQKGAMNLTGKYMEIFVREALARAKNERELSVKAGGISDGFLQVEDLEKLAPQLILDF